jgi:phosphoglycerate dehydrogenase-like enzyme
MELRGKQLGLVGVGRIGKAVAEKAPAFGMTVAYTDMRDAGIPGATQMPLDRLLATSDIVSVHVPMTPETKHLIDQKALTKMKRNAYLINTSRGEVLDINALAEALKNKKLAAAAIDVFHPEPPPANFPMLGMENVILTPHMAARTHTAIENMSWVVRDVIDVLSGKPARFPAP